jgi:hypothetical protein
VRTEGLIEAAVGVEPDDEELAEDERGRPPAGDDDDQLAVGLAEDLQGRGGRRVDPDVGDATAGEARIERAVGGQLGRVEAPVGRVPADEDGAAVGQGDDAARAGADMPGGGACVDREDDPAGRRRRRAGAGFG